MNMASNWPGFSHYMKQTWLKKRFHLQPLAKMDFNFEMLWLLSRERSRVLEQFGTFYPLTQSMELLHGATVTLLALALCILLQGCDREGLLQCQHDLIHLQVGKKRSLITWQFSSDFICSNSASFQNSTGVRSFKGSWSRKQTLISGHDLIL